MADYIRTFGVSEDYIKIALWNYYHRAKAVDIILGNAKIFRHYGRIDLKGSSFRCLSVRTTVTGVHGEMRAAGVANEFMKEQTFLQITEFQ